MVHQVFTDRETLGWQTDQQSQRLIDRRRKKDNQDFVNPRSEWLCSFLSQMQYRNQFNVTVLQFEHRSRSVTILLNESKDCWSFFLFWRNGLWCSLQNLHRHHKMNVVKVPGFIFGITCCSSLWLIVKHSVTWAWHDFSEFNRIVTLDVFFNFSNLLSVDINVMPQKTSLDVWTSLVNNITWFLPFLWTENKY